jgi:hypothetical protein
VLGPDVKANRLAVGFEQLGGLCNGEEVKGRQVSHIEQDKRLLDQDFRWPAAD